MLIKGDPNLLLNNKILHLSKFKPSADDNLNVAQTMQFVQDGLENTAGNC